MAAEDVVPVEVTSADGLGFLRLVWSDYLASRQAAPEPLLRSLALLLPRMVFNPSLQLALLVRIAQRGPTLLQHPVRWLQMVLFSSDIYWFNRPGSIEIGPGICFPHPTNILIGAGTRIGRNVTLYHEVTIGSDRNFVQGESDLRAPVIGDYAVVYSASSLQGEHVIGDHAVVGRSVLLDEDVPPGALKTKNRLRLRGEWPGEDRWAGTPAA
jgi:serine acetyltransferase